MSKTNLIFAFSSFALRGEGEDQTFTQEQVNEAVAAAVAKANDESKTAFEKTKGELLSDLKKTKEAMKAFEGIDPEKFKSMTAAFENDQDLKDIADGKINDVIDRRLERERATFKTTLESAQSDAEKYKNENSTLVDRVSRLMIDNNVVSEFVKEKGLESGIQDVILRANSIFKVEGDDLIARDQKGEIITGKNGPITIQEWVGSLKESAPHLFPQSSGSGAPGGQGGQGGNNLESKIQAAAASGDMKEYRRLRKLQKEGKKD